MTPWYVTQTIRIAGIVDRKGIEELSEEEFDRFSNAVRMLGKMTNDEEDRRFPL